MLRNCRLLMPFSVLLLILTSAMGQNASDEDATGSGDLKNEQMSISGRYARFEKMLTQMADIMARQDPERADLLRRALGRGREDLLREKIEDAVGLLSDGDLGAASEKQQEIVASLQSLLSLMQSEDRRSSVERERERLNGVLKNVRQVMERQKAARISTQLSPAPSDAAPRQQQALDEAESLLEDIKSHDGDGKDQGEGKQGEGKQGGSEDSPDGTQPGADEQGQPNSENNGNSEAGENGEPSEQFGDSQSSEGQSSENSGQQGGSGQQQNSPNTPQTPGKEQLQKAQQQMQQALEAMQEQQRDQALKNEDQALQELREAEEKLEEQLRQLREEEKEMMLASLEARFQRLLIVQTQIHERTISLAEVPKDQWLDLAFARCREVAQEQTELARECAGTVALLQEDGTSSAILLAVEDIEADMNSAGEWLRDSDVSELTRSVQQDVIDALKQLVEVMQKEMQDMQQQQQQSQQQQGPNSQQSPLVELIAEIKVLRNLQLQVNQRTERVDRLLQTVPAERLEALRQQISELSHRQERLLESARELQRRSQSQR